MIYKNKTIAIGLNIFLLFWGGFIGIFLNSFSEGFISILLSIPVVLITDLSIPLGISMALSFSILIIISLVFSSIAIYKYEGWKWLLILNMCWSLIQLYLLCMVFLSRL
ncbi:hypothetical protein IKE_05682 [Bacillus cereus VD196]|uniref:Uncharacterized protein n=1 Tax=Bacillus cereus VD196 TaxID=1053243 RepID=A0A9W5PYV5_BACCE|nr:hypothetical protein [Bacillus cereus]EJR90858.1 hypothetical protein IKG_05864 [Bacillus cereus VD200]EOO62453.1 hypothetical protein IKE_05682 [Bacillus cereus VD196]